MTRAEVLNREVDALCVDAVDEANALSFAYEVVEDINPALEITVEEVKEAIHRYYQRKRSKESQP